LSGAGLNLVGNPSFEWGKTGWVRFSSSALVIEPGGFAGARCLRIVGPANLSAFGIDDSLNWVDATGPIGTRYSFSAWVRSASSLGSARLQLREVVGGSQVGATILSSPVVLTPDWQLVSTEYVNRAAGSTLDLQVLDQPLVPREVFLVDNISIQLVPETSPHT